MKLGSLIFGLMLSLSTILLTSCTDTAPLDEQNNVVSAEVQPNTMGCLDDFCFAISFADLAPAMAYRVVFIVKDDGCLYLVEESSDELYLAAIGSRVQLLDDSVNGIPFGLVTELARLSPSGDVPSELTERCRYSDTIWAVG